MLPVQINPLGINANNVPYDSEVEYVEVSNDNLYIDTLVIPQDDSVIELNCNKYPKEHITSTVAKHIFGVTRTTVTSPIGIRSVTFKKTITVDGNVYVSFTGASFGSGLGNRTQISPTPNPSYFSNVKVYADGMIIDGVVYPFTTASELPIGIDQPLVLFAVRYGANMLTGNYGPLGMQLTRFKITNSGIPAFDGIPVRVGTKGCLYDNVTKKLFYGQRGGDLTPGPDK